MPVTQIDITTRTDVADGETWGDTGAYEQIEGRVTFEVAPDNPANQAIIDLALAPRNASGNVTFTSDFFLFAPKDPARGNGQLLIDIPNRGNALTSGMYHRVPAILPEDRRKPGDGFLFKRGYTVMCIGWQWDAEGELAILHQPPEIEGITGQILQKLQSNTDRQFMALAQLGQTAPPYPVLNPNDPAYTLTVKEHEGAPRTTIDRAKWRFARVNDGVETASDSHIFNEDGFERGLIYELVYETGYTPVVGTGLLAVRDIASALRNGECELSPTGFDHVLGFGVSQTGRFLRQFLRDGLNVDEQQRKVFDGLHIHIAGAQRGDFNHRHAQPTVATVPSFGQAFPFAMTPAKDPLGDETAGLLDNLPAETTPKMIISNTSFEYWRGDASQGHILGETDLEEHPRTRTYLIAGTHHIGGILIGGKQISEIAATGLKVAMPLNVVNASPVNRALISALADWVVEDVAPPESLHPRLDDGTAVSRDVVIDAFRQHEVPDLSPQKLGGLRKLSFDSALPAGMTRQPVEEGEMYPAWVSAVDADLNEVAGIRLPDISVPVGLHTGWNPRAADTGAGDQTAIFAGFTSFFSREQVLSRYGDEARFQAQVSTAIDELVAGRYVLEEDRDWLMKLATERFQAAIA